MSDHIEIGTDGAGVMDCEALHYAMHLLTTHRLPVVLKPCMHEGEPRLLITGYSADDAEGKALLALGHSPDISTRAAFTVGLLVRATEDAHAITQGEQGK